MSGLDAGQLFEVMARELPQHAPAGPAEHILAARRALQAARRVEEFFYSEDEDSFAVVSRATGTRPFFVPEEEGEAPAPCQGVFQFDPTSIHLNFIIFGSRILPTW